MPIKHNDSKPNTIFLNNIYSPNLIFIYSIFCILSNFWLGNKVLHQFITSEGIVFVEQHRALARGCSITTDKELNKPQLIKSAQQLGYPELSVPAKIMAVDNIPVLGTGKTDYVGVKKLFKSIV